MLTTRTETYSFNTYRWELVRDRELFSRVTHCRQPQDAAELAHELIGTRDREHFIAILLNTRNKVFAVDTHGVGSQAHRERPGEAAECAGGDREARCLKNY